MRGPALFAASFAALLACAAAATAATPGTLGQQAQPRANAESVAVTSSVRSLYVVHCAGCHGRDGAGSRIGNVPDMRQLGRFLQVPGGREFVVSVPGVMGSGLTDAQVAEVTNWVLATLARESLPAEHRPYSAAEVQRARATPLVDVAAARSRIVKEAQDRGISID